LPPGICVLLLPLQSFLLVDFAQAAGVAYCPDDDVPVASLVSVFFGFSFKLFLTKELSLKATFPKCPPKDSLVSIFFNFS